MNLLATFDQNALANMETITETHGNDAGYLYLKMDKTGSWLFGRADDEVEDGSEWVINPLTAQSGYICWGEMGGAPLGERMTPLTGTPLSQDELPDTGYTWSPQLSLQLMCVSGGDEGTAVVYKVSSKGGVNVINKLLREVVARSKSGNSEVYPVVTLSSTQDKGSKYKTWYPVLEQKEWLGAEGFARLTAPDAVEQLEAAPEPEPEPAPEPEIPVRRRRRKTAA